MGAVSVRVRCGSCTYRANDNTSCDYFFITGHTRMAQPPEKCTFYKRGERCETPKEPQAPASLRANRVYDLDRAKRMWKAGATDREIAKAIGCSRGHVTCWRRNNGLRVNRERARKKGGREHGKAVRGTSGL